MPSDSLIGQKLSKYRIAKRIGRGGMADVYKGRESGKKGYVAIKLVGKHLRADPAFTKRFRREARAVKSLNHPNIISLLDFGEHGGGHYMVMEYVDGPTLRGRMNYRFARNQTFSPQEIVDIIEPVAAALDFAHRQGMVHRDVKPANILLPRKGGAILTDFGLVMLLDRLSQQTQGEAFGTAEYIAPEQAIDSSQASARSDVYALGVILYELTTGRLPFDGSTAMSLALKHIGQEPERPRKHAPDLPLEVEAVILRAMAKEPKRRYASAGGLAVALRQAYGERVSPPAPPRSRSRPRPKSRPKPQTTGRRLSGRWLALGVVALLVVLGLIFGLKQVGDGPPEAVARRSRPVDGMTVRFVPGGPFLMGSPEGASDALSHEQPQHRVELDPFWLDQTEVSNAQYRLCVEAEACQPPVMPTFFEDESYAGHPVVYVTWEQASAYCAWLAQESGWPVALPSEAQWEKAAAWDPQLEGHRRYPWGDESPTPDLVNLSISGLGRTAPVDSYPAGASFYGPRNLAGNVWEWVADWYQPDYYSAAPSSNPSGPETGGRRVIRGGGYGHGAVQARTAHRDSASPTASGNALGFRCATNAEDLP